MNTERTPFGVLLVNLGTPDAPTSSAIRRYLGEFLWDKRVVNIPRPIWWLILNGIILRTRPKKVAQAYKSVWTEQGSPLLAVSKLQQQSLSIALAQEFNAEIPVALGMTYGNPSIQSALDELKQQVERVLVLPLYPQYSSSTTAAVFDAVAKVMNKEWNLPELRFVKQYYDQTLYIKALADSVKRYREQHGAGQKLLMSFHGVPQRFDKQGDPYSQQCRATADALAQELGLSSEQYLCTFQSRFGAEEWVKPYTDETLVQWAKDGVKRVDVISPAFAADCLETLEELEMENREYFIENGGEDYHYIPCLNDNPKHIALLSALVKQHSLGWLEK